MILVTGDIEKLEDKGKANARKGTVVSGVSLRVKAGEGGGTEGAQRSGVKKAGKELNLKDT